MSLFSGADGRILAIRDVDSILALIMKSLEGADQVTRQSLARLAGHMRNIYISRASTQIERAIPVPEVSLFDCYSQQNWGKFC